MPFLAVKSAYPPVESVESKNQPIGANKVPNSTALLPRAQRRAQILRSSAGSAPADRFIQFYTWSYRRSSRYLLHFFTDLRNACTGLVRITHPSSTPVTANPYLTPFGRNLKKHSKTSRFPPQNQPIRRWSRLKPKIDRPRQTRCPAAPPYSPEHNAGLRFSVAQPVRPRRSDLYNYALGRISVSADIFCISSPIYKFLARI